MNNQFNPFITRIPATLVVAIFVACSGSSEDRIEFSALNEDQRRRPENALAGMKVIEGLEVELFAAEPMVTNPTNISIDDHGRVWVCEAYNYDVSPEEEDQEGDRIVVLEDTDSDGKADKRTVFYQGTDITTPLGIFVAGDLRSYGETLSCLYEQNTSTILRLSLSLALCRSRIGTATQGL